MQLSSLVSKTSTWEPELDFQMYIFLGSGNVLEEALSSIVRTISDVDWTVKDGEKDVKGIEHPAIHMVLKKLAQNDKVAAEENRPTFGAALVQALEKKTVRLSFKAKATVLNRIFYLAKTLVEDQQRELPVGDCLGKQHQCRAKAIERKVETPLGFPSVRRNSRC